MNLTQIEHFIAVYETGSFTKASEECFIAQPSLWASIKRLEKTYNTSLFKRKKKEIFPTHIAHHLYPKFKQLLAMQTTIDDDIKIFKRKKRTPVIIGIQDSIGPKNIVKHLKNSLQKKPTLEISCHFFNIKELYTQIQKFKLDFIITSSILKNTPHLNTKKLYEEPYNVIVAKNHPLSKKKHITIEQISQYSYIDRLFCETRDALFSETKIKKLNLFAQYRSQRDDFIQEWVAEGLGVAIMPKYSICHPNIISIPYNNPSPKRTIYITHHNDNTKLDLTLF